MLVIGAAALLLFGPKRLPELAKNLGKGIRDFKKALEGNHEEETPKVESGEPTSTTDAAPNKTENHKTKV